MGNCPNGKILWRISWVAIVWVVVDQVELFRGQKSGGCHK